MCSEVNLNDNLNDEKGWPLNEPTFLLLKTNSLTGMYKGGGCKNRQ